MSTGKIVLVGGVGLVLVAIVAVVATRGASSPASTETTASVLDGAPPRTSSETQGTAIAGALREGFGAVRDIVGAVRERNQAAADAEAIRRKVSSDEASGGVES